MISTLSSPTGLTLMASSGEQFRIPREHAAYADIQALLNADPRPEAARLAQIRQLLHDPLAAIKSWAARMGVDLAKYEQAFDIKAWSPYLCRLMAVGATPLAAVFASSLLRNTTAQDVDQDGLCLRWLPKKGAIEFLHGCMVPEYARVGDIMADVASATAGAVHALVAKKAPVEKGGVIVQLSLDGLPFTDVLQEPAILGLNRTYRAEVASDNGENWDLVFAHDSLRRVRQEIQWLKETGAETRIVNCTTGHVI